MPNIFGLFLFSCMLNIFSIQENSEALAAQHQECAVLRVIDGDTLCLECLSMPEIRLRLYGIDCPEDGQEFGDEATEAVCSLLHGRNVGLEALGTDRYGRTIGIIILPDGTTLQESLLEQGLAWVAPQYCKRPECRAWEALEANARREKHGLWRHPHPSPPWEWRKRKRDKE